MQNGIILLMLLYTTSFVSIDKGTIKLDGNISETEWVCAKKSDLSSGGKLYVLHKKNVLYIGIRGISSGWSHVYLSWNDTVRVLHASAALGDQLYTKEKDS